MDRVGVGCFGQQPAREVLQADARGSETANHRRAELGAARERNNEGATRGLKEDLIMFGIKVTKRIFSDWRRPDDMMREVETELRFHIEMRTRANIEQGMRPDDAQRAALQSFGDFEQVRNDCCEIRRSLPFDSTPLRMGLHITIAIVAGLAALWAVNVPHHTVTGVMRQLIAIAVLTYLFIVVQRARSKRQSDSEHVNGVFVTPSETFHPNQSLTSDISEPPSPQITAYDEQGRTPVERVFKS